MAAHTPGPWTYHEGNDREGIVRTINAPGMEYGLFCSERYYPSVSENEADWPLVAAAPDLLEALRGILEIGKRDLSNPKYDGYFDSARAAIAKAEGC